MEEKDEKRHIKTAGNIEEMYLLSIDADCGGLRGPVVSFGDNAGFVIALEDLKQIVAESEQSRKDSP